MRIVACTISEVPDCVLGTILYHTRLRDHLMLYASPRRRRVHILSSRREEPRHTPTRVTFFERLDGGRVCSAAGGRTSSAVTTADGRLFEWGMRDRGQPWRCSNCLDEGTGSGETRGTDGAKNGEDAEGASLPRQVSGVGLKVRGVL